MQAGLDGSAWASNMQLLVFNLSKVYDFLTTCTSVRVALESMFQIDKVESTSFLGNDPQAIGFDSWSCSVSLWTLMYLG